MLFQYSNPILMNLLISELCTYTMQLDLSHLGLHTMCEVGVTHTQLKRLGEHACLQCLPIPTPMEEEVGLCLFPLTQTVLHHQSESYFPLRNRQVLGFVPRGVYIDGIVILLYSDNNCCKIVTMWLFILDQTVILLYPCYSKVRLKGYSEQSAICRPGITVICVPPGNACVHPNIYTSLVISVHPNRYYQYIRQI